MTPEQRAFNSEPAPDELLQWSDAAEEVGEMRLAETARRLHATGRYPSDGHILAGGDVARIFGKNSIAARNFIDAVWAAWVVDTLTHFENDPTPDFDAAEKIQEVVGLYNGRLTRGLWRLSHFKIWPRPIASGWAVLDIKALTWIKAVEILGNENKSMSDVEQRWLRSSEWKEYLASIPERRRGPG